MSYDESSDTRLVLDTVRDPKTGRIGYVARPKAIPENVKRACAKHALGMIAKELNRALGRVHPDMLSVLRWMNGRLAHETRADGSCERHCVRCQLEADPVIQGEREYRRRVAA